MLICKNHSKIYYKTIFRDFKEIYHFLQPWGIFLQFSRYVDISRRDIPRQPLLHLRMHVKTTFKSTSKNRSNGTNEERFESRHSKVDCNKGSSLKTSENEQKTISTYNKYKTSKLFDLNRLKSTVTSVTNSNTNMNHEEEHEVQKQCFLHQLPGQEMSYAGSKQF